MPEKREPPMLNLEPIKKREAQATKGVWRVVDAGYRIKYVYTDSDGHHKTGYATAEDVSIVAADDNEVLGCSEWLRAGRHDLEFMAHARSDIPVLITEIERLRAALLSTVGVPTPRPEQEP